jgi:hypothetical protein
MGEENSGAECEAYRRESGVEEESDRLGFVEQMASMGMQAVRRKNGDVMSLVELQSLGRSESQASAKILSIILGMVAYPIAAQTSEEMQMKVGPGMDQKVGASVGEGGPEPIARVLAAASAQNLTNIMEDGIAARAIPQITSSLSDQLMPWVVNKLSDLLEEGHLSSRAASVITTTVGARISKEIPDLVERTLTSDLVQGLTRSLTHALVPTLTLALTHDEEQDALCRLCFEKRIRCDACHYSPQYLYYLNYYSSYYADYYSSYMADYYGQASEKLELVQHPPGHWLLHHAPTGALVNSGSQTMPIDPGHPTFVRTRGLEEAAWSDISGAEGADGPFRRIPKATMRVPGRGAEDEAN